MTISKGQAWGVPGTLPEGAPVVDSDAALRALWEGPILDGEAPPLVGVLGGDLARTCGSPGSRARLRSDDARHLPVDVVELVVDGRRHIAVAHIVARRSWWRGRIVAAMNAQFLGAWDVAPRSHPNDGRFDLFDADLTTGDRLKARPRLRTGTHVPHPGISERRLRAHTVAFARPMHVWVDGERIATAAAFELRAIPDAGTIVV